jgi:hypothetical protein
MAPFGVEDLQVKPISSTRLTKIILAVVRRPREVCHETEIE